ncbi:MAG: DNA polymerase [Pseudomonadota bacterium]
MKKTKNNNFTTLKPPEYQIKQVSAVTSVSGLKDIYRLVKQRQISHIGIDIKADANDFSFDQPSILSLTLAETVDKSEGYLYCYIIDLQKAVIQKYLHKLLNLHVVFVGHNFKYTLHHLWQLNLPVPDTFWDTNIYERAANLGLFNKKYQTTGNMDTIDQIRISYEIKAFENFQYSLQSICNRNGVPYSGNVGITLPEFKKINKYQRRCILQNAIVVAELYPFQVRKAYQTGILHHLKSIEMPWVKTNARMEWDGIKIDYQKGKEIIRQCDTYIKTIKEKLLPYGISDHKNETQIRKAFNKAGCLLFFRHGTEYTFTKEQLKKHKNKHPSIPLILALSRLETLSNSEILKPELAGKDKRIHPVYHQLGTATGRLTSDSPCIHNIDSLLHQIVVSEKGNLIGEVDWSAFEVGIAAAVYQDKNLINMFNTGDVYIGIAKLFYQKQLPKSALCLSDEKFKTEYQKLRDTIKTCILGILNGMTYYGIAERLNCLETEAKNLHSGFFKMFPDLRNNMNAAKLLGLKNNYATSITNLHRYRGKCGLVSDWEKRWLVGYPIHGTAASIFKDAGNRLYQLYKPYDAKIIIPMHDAFIFEAPFAVFNKVMKLTKSTMRKSVQSFFPELKPRVKVNISSSECWGENCNKDLISEWLRKNAE